MIPTLDKRSDLASGQFALKDNGDEVVLLNAELALADAVAYGSGDGVALNLDGVLDPASGFSLQRTPHSVFDPVIDQRHRFLFARPRPFESLDLPMPASKSEPRLSDGLMAVWGTLGAATSRRVTRRRPTICWQPRPPRGCTSLPLPIRIRRRCLWRMSPSSTLRAWRWLGPEDAEAIVYSRQMSAANDLSGLLDHLQRTSAPAQWVNGEGDPPPAFSLFAADDVGAPGGLSAGVDIVGTGRSFAAARGKPQSAAAGRGCAAAALHRSGRRRRGFWKTYPLHWPSGAAG